jgi:hypothetical protein
MLCSSPGAVREIAHLTSSFNPVTLVFFVFFVCGLPSVWTFGKQLLKGFFYIYGNFLLSFLLSNLQYDNMFEVFVKSC